MRVAGRALDTPFKQGIALAAFAALALLAAVAAILILLVQLGLIRVLGVMMALGLALHFTGLASA